MTTLFNLQELRETSGETQALLYVCSGQPYRLKGCFSRSPLMSPMAGPTLKANLSYQDRSRKLYFSSAGFG